MRREGDRKGLEKKKEKVKEERREKRGEDVKNKSCVLKVSFEQ